MGIKRYSEAYHLSQGINADRTNALNLKEACGKVFQQAMADGNAQFEPIKGTERFNLSARFISEETYREVVGLAESLHLLADSESSAATAQRLLGLLGSTESESEA